MPSRRDHAQHSWRQTGLVGLAVELAPILFVMEHAGAEPRAGGHLQPRWIGCGAQALEQDFGLGRVIDIGEQRELLAADPRGQRARWQRVDQCQSESA